MQSLTRTPDTLEAERTIPIETIDGITVRSHPFEEMLEDSGPAVEQLPLANYVPSDHLFAYFTEVSALREFLDGSAELFPRFESAFSVKRFDYALASRYLELFGLSDTILSGLESTDAVSEIALFMPDLFFLEGTDITAIVKTRSSDLAHAVMTLVGFDNPTDALIRTRALASGQAVHLALREDLIFLSTSVDELRAAINLHDEDQRRSLGQSSRENPARPASRRLPAGGEETNLE